MSYVIYFVSMKGTKEYSILADYSIANPEILFDLCPEGVVLKDIGLRYIYANKSYYDLFTIDEKFPLIGYLENKCLSEKNIKLIQDVDTEIKNRGYAINYIINTENNKILSITSSPVKNKYGFYGILSVVRDITLEESIKENFVKRHFEYINKEKSLQEQREIFVASVGHDLKNPTIAQIRGLELLLKNAFGKLNPEQKELLEMILDSCRYMNGMLSSLLETYRNYGGVIKLNFLEFDFAELINECVSEMMYVAKDKDLKIQTYFDLENFYIQADRVQIKRVIMNLLSNGIKYAFKNTTIKLKAELQKSNILDFHFENESPYIPEDKQKEIFARYVSYASVHKELGVGLGLYASKKIIESHEGNMYVKSYTDNRNIFGFKIPIRIIHPEMCHLVI